MKRTAALLAALTLILARVPASAFNQPAMNFGSTSFFDGGPVKPGLYMIEYFVFTDGTHARGNGGEKIPGGAAVSALAAVSQLAFHSNVKALGANLGAHATLPLVSATAKGTLGPVPLPANTAGFGDMVVGPYLQWNESTLLGKPFGHRLEFDLILPTGKYDPNYAVNPGFNHLTYNPFYAFTWHFAQGWETSWRVQYAWHEENTATGFKAGDLFFGNYAVSREVSEKLRLGAAGYFLKQVTDDKLHGMKFPDAREQAVAIGPGLVYTMPGAFLMLTQNFELAVRNRFGGTRTVLQLLHRF